MNNPCWPKRACCALQLHNRANHRTYVNYFVHRFGFINSATDRSQKQSSSAMFSTDHQYIHCTGNMFLLIPTQLQLQTGIQGIKSRQSIAGKVLRILKGL